MSNLNLKLVLEAIDKITAPIKAARANFVAAMRKMSKSVREVGDQIEKMGKKIREAGSFFTTRVTAPLAAFSAVSIRAAGNIEELRDSLTMLAGSADKAAPLLEKIKRMSETSPFDTADLGASAQALMMNGDSAEYAMKRMEMLGDIAAGAKKPLAEVTKAYLDMRTKGKTDASDLKSWVDAGVPVVQQLARMKGKSVQEIYNMAAAGKINFEDFRKAMEALRAEGGIFQGQMEKKAKSIFGVFKILKESVSNDLADVGQELYTSLKVADKVETLRIAIRRLTQGFMELPEPMKSFIVYGGMILAALGPVLLIFGQLTIGIGLLIKGFGLLGTAIAGLTAASAVGLLAIAGFAAAAYYLIKNWDKVREFFKWLWEDVKEMFTSSIDWIMDKLSPLTNAIAKIKAGWGSLFGDDAEVSVNHNAVAPVGTGMARSKLDAGGTVKIEIDDKRAKVTETKSNDRRMNFAPNTGLLMGGY